VDSKERKDYFILEGLLLIAAWQRTLDSMDLQEEIADAVLLVRLYGVLVQTSPD
jgi:hypothetical protein